MRTYSFADVVASLVGPGAVVGNLGSGAGVDEEGIDIEQVSDIDEMTVGADGQGMHSLINNRAGTVTIRLLKTSPVNAQLNAMSEFQRISAANHGQNTLTIVDKNSGDTVVCEGCAFKRVPTINYGKVGKTIEWVFNAIRVSVGLGAGVQA